MTTQVETTNAFEAIIHQLRNNLRPGGTLPVVFLKPYGNYMELNADFVSACIDEVEKMPMRVALGDKPSKLEQVAYMLLCESAYIDLA